MKVKVSVRQDDIAEGFPGDSCFCPVAIAARRTLHLTGLTVGATTLFTGKIRAGIYVNPPLPRPAQDFIARYDNDLPVGPFEFELDVPDGLAPAVTP